MAAFFYSSLLGFQKLAELFFSLKPKLVRPSLGSPGIIPKLVGTQRNTAEVGH